MRRDHADASATRRGRTAACLCRAQCQKASAGRPPPPRHRSRSGWCAYKSPPASPSPWCDTKPGARRNSANRVSSRSPMDRYRWSAAPRIRAADPHRKNASCRLRSSDIRHAADSVQTWVPGREIPRHCHRRRWRILGARTALKTGTARTAGCCNKRNRRPPRRPPGRRCEGSWRHDFHTRGVRARSIGQP